jgi:hypothetical protein
VRRIVTGNLEDRYEKEKPLCTAYARPWNMFVVLLRSTVNVCWVLHNFRRELAFKLMPVKPQTYL